MTANAPSPLGAPSSAPPPYSSQFYSENPQTTRVERLAVAISQMSALLEENRSAELHNGPDSSARTQGPPRPYTSPALTFMQRLQKTQELYFFVVQSSLNEAVMLMRQLVESHEELAVENRILKERTAALEQAQPTQENPAESIRLLMERVTRLEAENNILKQKTAALEQARSTQENSTESIKLLIERVTRLENTSVGEYNHLRQQMQHYSSNQETLCERVKQLEIGTHRLDVTVYTQLFACSEQVRSAQGAYAVHQTVLENLSRRFDQLQASLFPNPPTCFCLSYPGANPGTTGFPLRAGTRRTGNTV